MRWMPSAAGSRSRPSGRSDAVGDHCGGRFRVDADLAVGERSGADVPEGDVGVGQGRLGAAASVADRAGNGPGAARPYPQAPGGVEEGDAAAAGPDLGDVETGGADQLAAAPHQPAPRRQGGADLVLRAVADAAPLDHRCLGGGPPHVEGDDVADPRGFGRRGRGQHPGGRAGLEDEHRPLGGVRLGGQAAGRLHDQQRGVAADAAQAVPQGPEVPLHHRAHVGVDDGRGGALVLLALGKHLVGQRDRNPGQLAGQEVADRLLVPRVGVGVQQADRHRFDLLAEQPFPDGAQFVLDERPQHLAVGGDALAQLEAQAALDQLRRLVPEEVVDLRGADAAQLEDVAEAAGGHQGGARAAALEHGVGRHGGSVRHLADLGGCRAGPFEQVPGGLEHGALEVGRRRGDLVGPDRAAAVDEDDVGEGAADVGAHPYPAGGGGGGFRWGHWSFTRTLHRLSHPAGRI